MRIDELHVYGFGQLQDVSLRFHSGLNVVEGLNEAGKTTLMAFLRGVLFGFVGRRHPELRYEPAHGGEFGGALVLTDAAGQKYRIERIYRKKVAGDVTVQLPDGGKAGEPFLHQLLGQVNEKVFNNIFAFGLSELQQIDTLHEDDMNHFIYTAGTGDSHAIREAQKVLLDGQLSLFRPQGRKSSINVKFQQLREAKRDLNQLKEAHRQYGSLVAERDEWDRQLAREEREAEALRKQLIGKEKLRDHYDEYTRYILLQDRLATLPAIDHFPEDGVVRLDAFNEKIHERKAELKGLIERQERLEEQQQLPPDNERLLACQLDIEDVRDHLATYREHKQETERCRLDIRREEERLAGIFRQLGTSWDENRVVAFDTSLTSKRTVRAFDAALEDLRAASSLAKNERDKAHRDVQQRESDKREWQAHQVERPTKSEASLAEERSALTRVRHLEQRLLTLEHRLALLQEKIKNIEASETAFVRTKNPKKNPFWKWALLGLTIVLPLASWLGGQPLYAVLTLILLAGITVREFIKKEDIVVSYEEVLDDLAQKKEAAAKEQSDLQAEVTDVRSQVADMRRRFAQEGVPLHEWEQQWEREQAHFHRWQRWHEQYAESERAWREAQSFYAQADERWQQLQKEYDEKRQQWKQWLEENQLLETMDGDDTLYTPKLVLELMREIELAKETVRRVEELVSERQKHEQFLTDYLGKLKKILANTETAIKTDDAEFQVRELNRLLEVAKEESRRQQHIRAQLEEIREQRHFVEHRLHLLNKERSRLLREGGAADEEQFRLRMKQYRERKQLEQERTLLVRSLSRLSRKLYGSDHLDCLLSEMAQTSKAEIEEEWHALHEKWETLRRQLEEGRNKRATLNVKIEALTSGDELSEHQQHYEQLVSDVRQEAKQWATYAIAQHFLQGTIHLYEQEKQPGVLRQASRFLHVLTDGRYTRVLAPLGKQTIEVERHDKKRFPPAFLSRGTVEQLYLAIRFALAEEYTQQALLPLILDDIFVNFDPVRTRAAARTLQVIAGTRQIFFFTCHDHIVRLFEEEHIPHKRITLTPPTPVHREFETSIPGRK